MSELAWVLVYGATSAFGWWLGCRIGRLAPVIRHAKL